MVSLYGFKWHRTAHDDYEDANGCRDADGDVAVAWRCILHFVTAACGNLMQTYIQNVLIELTASSYYFAFDFLRSWVSKFAFYDGIRFCWLVFFQLRRPLELHSSSVESICGFFEIF